MGSKGQSVKRRLGEMVFFLLPRHGRGLANFTSCPLRRVYGARTARRRSCHPPAPALLLQLCDEAGSSEHDPRTRSRRALRTRRGAKMSDLYGRRDTALTLRSPRVLGRTLACRTGGRLLFSITCSSFIRLHSWFRVLYMHSSPISSAAGMPAALLQQAKLGGCVYSAHTFITQFIRQHACCSETCCCSRASSQSFGWCVPEGSNAKRCVECRCERTC